MATRKSPTIEDAEMYKEYSDGQKNWRVVEREINLAQINLLRSSVVVDPSQSDDSSLTTLDVSDSDSGSNATASQDQDEEIKSNLSSGYNAEKDQNVEGQTTPNQDDVSLSDHSGYDANFQKMYESYRTYHRIIQYVFIRSTYICI